MSHETRQLWVNKYPNLKTLAVEIELWQPFVVYLDKGRTQWVTITFFDANHWPGSIMMLFEGPMGTIFHTGDFRFTQRFFNYSKLFPKADESENGQGLAIDIDILIWDGTFSDPNYIFQSQQEAYSEINNTF